MTHFKQLIYIIHLNRYHRKGRILFIRHSFVSQSVRTNFDWHGWPTRYASRLRSSLCFFTSVYVFFVTVWNANMNLQMPAMQWLPPKLFFAGLLTCALSAPHTSPQTVNSVTNAFNSVTNTSQVYGTAAWNPSIWIFCRLIFFRCWRGWGWWRRRRTWRFIAIYWHDDLVSLIYWFIWLGYSEFSFMEDLIRNILFGVFWRWWGCAWLGRR